MAQPRRPGRYVLVPRAGEERARAGDEPAPAVGGARVRRYSLARVAVSPRSALGADRHERLERVAERG
ncbi:MAG TPA: hypothetical protein VKB17_01955 [Thermoleophilaceae bacterium]|nr:hypothetical protein [Thermoleophilaceae bacterium]